MATRVRNVLWFWLPRIDLPWVFNLSVSHILAHENFLSMDYGTNFLYKRYHQRNKIDIHILHGGSRLPSEKHNSFLFMSSEKYDYCSSLFNATPSTSWLDCLTVPMFAFRPIYPRWQIQPTTPQSTLLMSLMSINYSTSIMFSPSMTPLRFWCFQQ